MEPSRKPRGPAPASQAHQPSRRPAPASQAHQPFRRPALYPCGAEGRHRTFRNPVGSPGGLCVCYFREGEEKGKGKKKKLSE